MKHMSDATTTHAKRFRADARLPGLALVLMLVLTTCLSACSFAGENRVPADWDPERDDNLVTPAPKTPGYQELELTLGEGDWTLNGKLCLPEEAFFPSPWPVVVLVSGSGPNDMDETLYSNKPFRDLAHGLATRGVATLRYNKISKENPNLLKRLEETLTLNDEYLPDADAALRYLKTTSGIDPNRIFILGHGLGGTAIPRIHAAQTLPAGYILFAGGTAFLADEVLRQYTYLFNLDGKLDTDETAAIAQVEADLKRLYDMLEGLQSPKGSILGAPFSYWRDLYRNDPLQAAAAIDKPVLILQGGRDYNVLPESADFWAEALDGNPDVTKKLYPSLNHLFLAGEGPDDPVNLLTPAIMDDAPIDDMASWVLAR